MHDGNPAYHLYTCRVTSTSEYQYRRLKVLKEDIPAEARDESALFCPLLETFFTPTRTHTIKYAGNVNKLPYYTYMSGKESILRGLLRHFMSVINYTSGMLGLWTRNDVEVIHLVMNAKKSVLYLTFWLRTPLYTSVFLARYN